MSNEYGEPNDETEEEWEDSAWEDYFPNRHDPRLDPENLLDSLDS